MSDTDLQLLARYTRQHAEDAFTELVRRHLNLVYSAALRQVRSPQLAEEVAQSVFTDLARNARCLSPDTIVTAWLYQVTRRTAIDVVRSEARRQLREQIATEMNAMNATMSRQNEMTADASDWTHIEPLLDDAMAALDEADRAAVLLRYFENKSLRQVGQQLGVSDDAAQKRVSRAVERLRKCFSKRGVAVGASGLIVVISAHAVQAAPVGLAVTISAAAALAGTSIVATATATATKAIAMTTLQKTIIGATLAAAVGTGIYEAHQNSKLREANESSQQQITQLKNESEDLSNRLAAIASTKSPATKSLPDEQFNELLRLRGEVGVLRRQTNELGTMLAKSHQTRQRAADRTTEQQPPSELPEDYPKSADGATRGIFEGFARGDWDAFYAKFDVDGGREMFDKAMSDEFKNSLLGMEVVSIGTPTNSFASNMWFVPYTVRFKSGSEKTLRLHVAQDPKTQRWILKGGF